MACAGDAALRERVESLLAAQDQPEELLADGIDAANAPRRITESLERLALLYDAWGKPAQAAEWKQKLAAFQQANKVSDNKSKTP